MKNLTLLACIILLAIKTNAQDSSATINTSWIGYTLDTSLTFQQIVNTCDSQFNAAGYPAYSAAETSDTGADLDGSSFYSYELWKNFYATRLDLATGRPHSFAADALAFLSGSAASTNCGGTSPIQSNPGWQFIGPQNIVELSSGTTLDQHLGEINGVVVNTATPTNIYVTDAWGGLWETTNAPAVGGYEMHTNIIANPPTLPPELRNAVFSQYNIGGQVTEFPYNNEDEIFDADKINEALKG